MVSQEKITNGSLSRVGTVSTMIGCMLAVISLGVSQAAGVGVSDDFEDGNWTINPTWIDTNPGYGVDGGFIADPLRANNLVWKAKGTGTAARHITTSEFEPLTWTGFHASVEVLYDGTDCNSVMTVWDYRSPGIYGFGDEGFLVGFDVGRSDPTKVRLQILERNAGTWFYHPSIMLDRTTLSVNEWVQVNLWHDPVSNMINANALRLSDGHVYIEDSHAPMSFGALPLSYFELAAGTNNDGAWNYMDNPTLTPEPATLSLLVLSGLAFIRRRKHQA